MFMNKKEMDILLFLSNEPFISQRVLANNTGYSLGSINKSIKELIKDGYLDESCNVTLKALNRIQECKPKNAIILAAGYGMRMVPINTETPKGLLLVNGVPLIERIINQLHDAGISEIYIVVGFMKEHYEYLIDKYNVNLIVNMDYSIKNNLHSLNLVKDHLSNSYIIPCDIWCENNPFKKHELYSWYMVTDNVDDSSIVRLNRKNGLTIISDDQSGNSMIGISYLLEEECKTVKEKLNILCHDKRYNNSFWEDTLIKDNNMIVYANVCHLTDAVEINTYEQLRELDESSKNLNTNTINIIADTLKVNTSEITNIRSLKKGMTNRSFLFKCNGHEYIMRIPGEGTDQLINRKEEYDVYQQINGKNISDECVYMNPDTGYKITKFIENSRCCDPLNMEDVKNCMQYLRKFHNMKLKTDHEFNCFEKIDFYESLWEGKPSMYSDYEKTKKNVFSLKSFIDKNVTEKCLTHIDAVPDNFLMVDQPDGSEKIRLIDWEYSGMQDPHVDIAMFAIYSLYNKEQVDALIDCYFTEGCTLNTRIKIYCYIAVCGLLWSNWCEYKYHLGVEFGEYSLRQYRYGKDFYKIAIDLINKEDTNV